MADEIKYFFDWQNKAFDSASQLDVAIFCCFVLRQKSVD